MLASTVGVEVVMNLKEDQARNFGDKLAEVRYYDILGSEFWFQVLIPGTRPDRHRWMLEEDLLEGSPETMRRIRRVAGLI